MGNPTCSKPECTVRETGICFLSQPDPKACPNVVAEDGTSASTTVPTGARVAVPVAGSAARTFHSGLELGVADSAELMRGRYAHVIGIVGSYDAGKTCFLLSLYLLAANGLLSPKYSFAGSATLEGFEQRAHRVRRWNKGALPAQLADHTILADARQAAFLHLALRNSDGERSDLLLTDLPGEWSNDLVDRAATADRWRFLRRADGVILVIDGPLFMGPQRHSELQRAKHLLSRLVGSVGLDKSLPVVVLVSKCDLIKMQRPPLVDDLAQHAKDLGLSVEVVLSAAFSSTPETTANGTGVLTAIEAAVRREPAHAPPRPAYAPLPGRFFHRFGSVS